MKVRYVLLGLAVVVGAALAWALASPSAETQQKPLKIGVVDGQLLLEGYDATKEAQKKVDEIGGKWDAKIKALSEEYQTLVNEFNKDKAFLDASELRRRQREIDDKLLDLQDAQKNGNDEIVALRENLLRPILETADNSIQAYGEEEGFDLLLEKRVAVLYRRDDLDVTDKIVERLNAELKAADAEGSEEDAGAAEKGSSDLESAEAPPKENQ